jgi:2-methylcitrate dehydratase PrpD
MIIDMVQECCDKKQSMILGHGGKLPAHNAAMVNAIMARSYDFEPPDPTVDGKSTPKEFIRNPRIMDIVGKIRPTAAMPPETPLAASVKIRTKQGMEYNKQVDISKGNDTATPVTEDEKRGKFFDDTAFSRIIALKQAEKALMVLDRVEDIDNMSKIAKLLVGR